MVSQATHQCAWMKPKGHGYHCRMLSRPLISSKIAPPTRARMLRRSSIETIVCAGGQANSRG